MYGRLSVLSSGGWDDQRPRDRAFSRSAGALSEKKGAYCLGFMEMRIDHPEGLCDMVVRRLICKKRVLTELEASSRVALMGVSIMHVGHRDVCLSVCGASSQRVLVRRQRGDNKPNACARIG